jgi:protein-tyrosine kinase
MTKVYDALRRAEQERSDQRPGGELMVGFNRAAPQSPALRQKLIAIYQGIESRLSDKASKVITFVAPQSGAGTSTLVRELAKLVSTEFAQSVVLIDATQGQGGHHECFGAHLEAGLEAVVSERLDLDAVLLPVNHDSMSLGCLATNDALASTVVTNPKFRDVVKSLREKFSLILFDAPSLADSSDALLITAESDGVILVVEAEKTRWQAAETARKRIVAQGGNILGVVLNRRQFHIPYFIYKRL